MRKIFSQIIVLFFISGVSFAQVNNAKIYDPNADAKADLAKAIRAADSLNKNVFVQIGGNWCPWCVKFTKFCKNDSIIDTLMSNNYIILHLNYSKENKNLDVLKSLDYPQRFGFPVVVILDRKGKLIHTQDSSFLESGDGYDRNKIIIFLKGWTLSAIDPKKFDK